MLQAISPAGLTAKEINQIFRERIKDREDDFESILNDNLTLDDETQKFSVKEEILRRYFPTAAEVIHAIPPEGLTAEELVTLFAWRITHRHEEFIELILNHIQYVEEIGVFVVPSEQWLRDFLLWEADIKTMHDLQEGVQGMSI